MIPEDFTAEQRGRLVQIGGGNYAFVPSGLPPNLTWGPRIISLISTSDRALGRLAGIATGELSGFSPTVLIRPFVRREAVLSSRIEGTKATLSDLLRYEDAQESTERDVPDVREVANYVRALEFGRHAIQQRPISASLIKELHQALTQGVRGGEMVPGAFREEQVFIGSSDRLRDARFVPPPPALVPSLMDDLIGYVGAPSYLPPLIKAALVHFQFEAIHPFRDGNGRIGRLLIMLMLCSPDVLPVPMLYLSAYLERNRSSYYDHLTKISRTGVWTDWIEFFLEGVVSEAADAVRRAADLMSLRAGYHVRMQRSHASALTIKLIDSLFSDPAVTARRAATVLDATVTSAQTHIDRLVASGILKEITGGKRNRIYFALEIVKMLEER